ncbi:MAG: DNA repair and recombination protein RadB [Halobacteriales archaeon]
MTAPVSTGCAPIDELLGGGLPRGTVTQFYGPPASGKTNVALSAAIEVAATAGTAVYIDTEGLSIDRFEQLAAARGDADALADRMVIKEAHDWSEQASAVKDAAEFADGAELIVLDSATGFYRLERTADQEDGDALRTVAKQLTGLLSLARRYDLGVLVTNQVYTDPDTDRAKPLGGYTLAHWTGVIVRLERFRADQRRASLEKHKSKPTGESARFAITATGLSGAEMRR